MMRPSLFSLVHTTFFQVWLWAHFRGCCPRLKELNIVGKKIYMDNRGRQRRARVTVGHHRMDLYERVMSKKEFNFCEQLDKIEAFTFCPYNYDICGLAPYVFAVDEPDYWYHIIPNVAVGIDCDWDFIAATIPCSLLGFFG